MAEEGKSDTGIINIRGRQYKTVALRVTEFRRQFPAWTIKTEIVEITPERVLIRAEVLDETGRLLADGYAEEDRASSQINRVSAVENCQTSAIGRALACFGFVGSEFASEEEIANAKQQANIKEEFDRMAQHMRAVMDHSGLVLSIKAAIAEEKSQLPAAERSVQIEDAAAAWFEVGEDTQRDLWRAPSKGGCFTTAELAFIKEHFRRLAYGEAAA